MSTSVTHQRVSDDVSANCVNRVNRAQGGGARAREDRGGTGNGARQVWSNVEALKGLLARADRELAREPGGYVAVAAVGADKREEQVGRWGWAGSRDAGGRVAVLGNGLVAEARGLRVRVHREGGGLVGSALLRRTAEPGPAPDQSPPGPGSNRPAAASDTDRLVAIEALLSRLLADSSAQDREIVASRRAIAQLSLLPAAVKALGGRLDDLEALAAGEVRGADDELVSTDECGHRDQGDDEDADDEDADDEQYFDGDEE